MVLKQDYFTDPNPIKMNEFESARKVIEMVTGVDVYSKCRKRDVVEARMMLASMLREMGFSLNTIGSFLNKDHTTIIHYTRKLNQLIDVDKVFLTKYLKCRELMIFKEQPVNLAKELDYVNEVEKLKRHVEVLKKEKKMLVAERDEIIEKYASKNEKRLSKVFKLIEENTPLGHEFIVERKLIKMFDE
jgi:transcriptional regulator of heat shock response